MLKLKDVNGVDREVTRLMMEVWFDVDKPHENNSDYEAFYLIVGFNYDREEFIVMQGADYYEIADAFIDLKKKLRESEPTIEELLAEIMKNEEVATV